MFVVVIFFSHVQLLRFVVVKNFQSFSNPKFSHIYLVMWISLSVSPSQEQNHCNILNKLSDIYSQKFHLLAITYKMTQAVHIKLLLYPPTPTVAYFNQPNLLFYNFACFYKILMKNGKRWGKNIFALSPNAGWHITLAWELLQNTKHYCLHF